MLYLVPPKLLALGWNERPFTLEDFEQIAWDEGIWFYKKRLRYDEGMFFYFFERPIIVINSLLPPPKFLWAAFHELIHYFLHPPELQYFAPGTDDKADFQANIITSVALIPKKDIETKTFAEIKEETGFPDELLWIRKDAFERYDF